MDYIGELPLTEFPSLLSFAERKEAEESTKHLYIAHYMLSKMQNKEPIGFDEFFAKVLEEPEKTARDPETIDKEISRVIEAYEKRKEA